MQYSWRPQAGTQLKAITATWCEELFFGGARGGGKSDFLLGDFAQDVNIYKENWHGIIFRKIAKELDELIKRSNQIFTPMGAVFKVQEKKWIFPNGATFRLAFLERDDDADKYQGLQFTWIGWDELPNWATDIAYNKLKACLRSPHYIPLKRIRSSGNPGGAGQDWVKKRFVEPNPRGFTALKDIRYININTGAQIELSDVDESIIANSDYKRVESTRMFIPSRLQDNKILMDNDPMYIARLTQAGGKELVRAWLAGDWNAIEGAYFDTFDQTQHVIEPFMIPNGWTKIRSFDWGYSAPFAVCWGALSDGSAIMINGKARVFPRGSIIIYREYYGTTGKPNEGLKINADEIARNIVKYEEMEKIHDYVADPAIYDVSTGPSIAEQMYKEKCYWRPADNKRVAGWQQIRQRFTGIDGKPLLYFFNTCQNLIRTLPIMQYDKTRPEDLDTKLEDHACFIAGTMVDTECGSVAIEKLDSKIHKIRAGNNWVSHYIPAITRKRAKTIKLTFSNGTQAICTPDHKILDITDTFRYAKDLLNIEVACNQRLLVRKGRNTEGRRITYAEITFKRGVLGCIGLFGRLIMALYQLIAIFITRIKINPITTWIILSAYHLSSTLKSIMMKLEKLNPGRILRKPNKVQSNGIKVKPEELGIKNIGKNLSENRPRLKMLKRFVKFARRNILRQNTVHLGVNTVTTTVKPLRCVSVEKWKEMPVYCLSEPTTNTFTIEGGIIVHNCDTLRYLVMARPITLNLEKKGTEISKQWYKDFNPAEVLKSLETQRNLQNFK